MPRLRDRRLRRLATGIAFAVGVGAIAATSPPQTRIDLPSKPGSFRLDAERPGALSRVIVRLSPEATSGYSSPRIELRVDSVREVEGGAASFESGAVQFIVTSATPGEVPVASESGPPIDEPIPDEPVPSAWEAALDRTMSVSLPIDCGSGPCERAYWLIAQLSEGKTQAVDVQWHVQGQLSFTGNTWPSGAGGSIEIEPSVLLAGPLPQLVAATPAESLTLGPANPAAARVIEVGIGAGAIPVDGSPGAVLAVEIERQRGDSDRSPLLHVYPLDAIGVDPNPDGPLPTAAPEGVDPFSGCDPGEPCRRRYLVTFEWTDKAGEDQLIDWTASVRRLDIARAWSAPAELSASVERRFDIDPDAPPSVAHLEGEATTSETGLPAQVQVELAAQTTATELLSRLLPAPAVMTYGATLIGADAIASRGGPRVMTAVALPGQESGVRQILTGFQGSQLEVTTNPLAGCRVGDACPALTIATTAGSSDSNVSPPTLRYAWRLDVTLYAFAEAPLTLTTLDQSP